MSWRPSIPRCRPPWRAVLPALLALLALAAPAAGQEAEAEAAQRLADRHAPIVVVRDQEEPCDRDGEAYRPVPVETVLDRPEVRLLDEQGDLVTTAPGAADIAGAGPGAAIDLPGNPRRPGCRYEQDFGRLGPGQPDTAYAHVARDPAAPGRIALQYWFFWYFDDYVNTHEGDWEFIQLVFDAPDAQTALAGEPVEVGYSQHSGGERAAWDDDTLERQGDRPVVYAAVGSHANYFTSDLFLGRNADEGFGCDTTRGPSTRLPTRARLLPDAPEPGSPEQWLLFPGRWGEAQPGAYGGPTGPLAKDKWTQPIRWQESLRDSSFAVPTAGTLGPTATGAFCTTVALGGRVYTAVTSPWVLMLLAVGLVATGGIAARSTTWSPRAPRPLRRERSSGQVLGASASLYRRHRWPMLALGLVFLPAALVETTAQALVLSLTPLGSLVGVAGESSMLSVAVALLVAGAGHLLAAGLVLGGVAALLDAADAGRPAGVRDALRLLGRRAWQVLGTVGLATLGIVGLAITLVGIPLAVERLVRWSVAVPACAIEGMSPRPALRRSAELTRGRWLRAARVAILVNLVAAVSGPALGIALLFLSTLPLGAINAVSSAVYVLTMPFAGAAIALLWGDLVSRPRGGPDR